MREARRGYRVSQARQGKGFGQKLTRGIGDVLSSVASKRLSTVLGAGDYEMAVQQEFPEDEVVSPGSHAETNSLFNPVSSDRVPMMHNPSQGSVRISHREYVSTLQALPAGGDYTQRFNLSPGDSLDKSIAPWLSGIAKHWQKYSWLGLSFEYIPTSSFLTTAASPALGSVNFGIKYNTEQGNIGFTWTQLAVLNLDSASSASPAASQMIPVECARDSTVIPTKFISDLDFSTPTDQNLYSLGELIVLVEGTAPVAAAWDIGQLWVTYDIILEGTKLPGNAPPPSFHYSTVLKALVEQWRALGRMKPTSPRQWIEWEDHRDDLVAKFSSAPMRKALRHAQLKYALAAEEAQKSIPVPPEWDADATLI
jgi:hypothetical protein